MNDEETMSMEGRGSKNCLKVRDISEEDIYNNN